MHIAVNTTFLTKALWETYHPFYLESIRLLAVQKHEHTFTFLVTEDLDSNFFTGTSIEKCVVGALPKNALMLKWWYDVTLPYKVKKLKADILINPDGRCSLLAKIPQIALFQDTDFITIPNFEKKPSIFYTKSWAIKCLQKANIIITGSQFSKQEIENKYHVNGDNIQVVAPCAHVDFKPMDWKQKEVVKNKYTNGKEFFLYRGPISQNADIIMLLKAFSLFKKRQLSNMQLLIVPNENDMDKDFRQKINTYKYRNEVALLPKLEPAMLAELTAAAYASVHPFAYGHETLLVVENLQCGTPMIVSQQGVMPEMLGDAALYADHTLPESIAEQMKTIYKDENLRTRLVANAQKRAKFFDGPKVAADFWQSIQSSVGGK